MYTLKKKLIKCVNDLSADWDFQTRIESAFLRFAFYAVFPESPQDDETTAKPN